MMLSLLIATLLSTVFIRIRRKEVLEEAEMVSYLSTVFISFIIIGVLSITSVLPVMLSIRDSEWCSKYWVVRVEPPNVVIYGPSVLSSQGSWHA